MYASSAATYGDGSLGYDDSDQTTCKLQPLNMYGYSKQIFDMWLLENGLINNATGLKFFNVFGPNEYHKGEMMSVVCKKFSEVNDKGQITLFKSYLEEYGHGEQKRDFIYVKDAVEVMNYFFNNPNKTGIFNLGTGQASSWNDLGKAMFAAVGNKVNIKYVEMPECLRPKYQYFTQAQMSKLRAAGCGVKFTSLMDAVEDYIKNYLSKEAYL